MYILIQFTKFLNFLGISSFWFNWKKNIKNFKNGSQVMYPCDERILIVIVIKRSNI